jgi:hypothetical protein
MTNKSFVRSAFIGAALMFGGCTSSDERAIQIATEGANRQAAQNQEMARLQREVTEGTRELVTSIGQARSEFTELHRDVQKQQAAIAEQFDALESERRAIAASRIREPLLAALITSVSTVLIACLPLALALYVLANQGGNTPDQAVLNDLLIEEFAADRPALLPGSEKPPNPRPQLFPRGDS